MLRKLLGCALCAALGVTVAAASRAAITSEGQVQLSSGTSIVGTSQGDGTVHVTPPSTLTASSLQIAQGFSSQPISGRVFVDGGAVVVQGDTIVGAGGRGLLEVTDGGTVDAPRLYVGSNSSSSSPSEGKVVIRGAGSKVRTREDLTIGYYTIGELTIADGGTLQPITPQGVTGTAYVGRNSGSLGTVAVDGETSSWSHQGEIVIGNEGSGMLNIRQGADVTGASATIGKGLGLGTVLISGPGSRLSADKITIGDRGVAEVRVEEGGTLDAGSVESQLIIGSHAGSFGRLTISGAGSRWVGNTIVGDRGNGELYLEGGVIATNGATLGRFGGSGLAVVRGQGTRWQPGSLVLGQQNSAAELRIEDGAVVLLPSVPALSVLNATSRVVLSGGTLTTPISTQQPVDGRGSLEGDGNIITAQYRNNGGRISIGAGDHLKFSAQLHNGVVASAESKIEVLGGELEVVGAFSNMINGRVIAENATLRLRYVEPSQNQGQIGFSAGANRVFGRMTNTATGTIAVTGAAKATFYDAMRNSGVMSASAGSSITMLSAFSGAGIAGDGTVNLEGPVQPGTSPGIMNFGGDVNFGGASRLEIDVAGTLPGSGFDQVNVDGAANLGGALRLTVLGGLSGNATLPIVRAGELFGTFDSLPAIGANVGAGVRFNGITYDYNHDEVLVSLTPGEAADFNLDGVVNGYDLMVWQQSVGAETECGVGADGNCDGVVDGADLAVWNASITSTAAQSATQAGVPEPGSLGLFLVAIVGGLGVGGRRVRLRGARLDRRF